MQTDQRFTVTNEMTNDLVISLNLMCVCNRMLRKDKEEVEAIKHAKALEAEKAMYSVWTEIFN